MRTLYIFFVIAVCGGALGYYLLSPDNFQPYFPRAKRPDGSVVNVMDVALLDKMEAVLKKEKIPYKRGGEIDLRVPAALFLRDGRIEELARIFHAGR